MNKIEEVVYHALYSHPSIKLFVRNLYQGFFDLMPRRPDFISGANSYRKGFFFGFHDVSPFSLDEKKILANKLPFDFRMPKAGEGMDVGYFDFEDGYLGEFHKLGTSYAWNYHKGCRLQWVGDNRVIFNNAQNGKIVSTIVNIVTGESENIDSPIDTIFFSEGKLIATTFSYERLQKCMPGYGYPYCDDSYNNVRYPSETGLFVLDLTSGVKKLIVPISVLKDRFCSDNPDKYYHYVTHSEFSLDGRYISFLYRRMIDGGDINKRITKIIVFDQKTGDLIELPTQTSGSHYVWNKSNQIIASCVMDGKSCHVMYDMKDVNKYNVVAPSILNQDGHQSFVNDKVFVTDTYPDKWRQVQLYKADAETGNVEKILNINSPKKYMSKTVYNYIDCDLHPRVSHSGKYVCCDTVNTGTRSLFVMEL